MRSPRVTSGIVPVATSLVMQQVLHEVVPLDKTQPQPFLTSHRALCNNQRMSDILVSAPQLAAALGVDRSTIHRRVARGDLTPFTVVGNRPFFLARDIEAMKRGEQQKEPAK